MTLGGCPSLVPTYFSVQAERHYGDPCLYKFSPKNDGTDDYQWEWELDLGVDPGVLTTIDATDFSGKSYSRNDCLVAASAQKGSAVITSNGINFITGIRVSYIDTSSDSSFSTQSAFTIRRVGTSGEVLGEHVFRGPTGDGTDDNLGLRKSFISEARGHKDDQIQGTNDSFWFVASDASGETLVHVANDGTITEHDMASAFPTWRDANNVTTSSSALRSTAIADAKNRFCLQNFMVLTGLNYLPQAWYDGWVSDGGTVTQWLNALKRVLVYIDINTGAVSWYRTKEASNVRSLVALNPDSQLDNPAQWTDSFDWEPSPKFIASKVGNLLYGFAEDGATTSVVKYINISGPGTYVEGDNVPYNSNNRAYELLGGSVFTFNDYPDGWPNTPVTDTRPWRDDGTFFDGHGGQAAWQDIVAVFGTPTESPILQAAGDFLIYSPYYSDPVDYHYNSRTYLLRQDLTNVFTDEAPMGDRTVSGAQRLFVSLKDTEDSFGGSYNTHGHTGIVVDSFGTTMVMNIDGNVLANRPTEWESPYFVPDTAFVTVEADGSLTPIKVDHEERPDRHVIGYGLDGTIRADTIRMIGQDVYISHSSANAPPYSLEDYNNPLVT